MNHAKVFVRDYRCRCVKQPPEHYHLKYRLKRDGFESFEKSVLLAETHETTMAEARGIGNNSSEDAQGHDKARL